MLFTQQRANKFPRTPLTTRRRWFKKRLPVPSKTKTWLKDVLLPPLLAFCAIYLVTAITTLCVLPYFDSPVLACSMGASAVLLFVSPTSRFSTPWPLFGGHLFSALAGIICAVYIPDLTLCAATAVGGSMVAMQLFRCMNPPGAATALAPVITPHPIDIITYYTLIPPLLTNVLVLILFSALMKKLIPLT